MHEQRRAGAALVVIVVAAILAVAAVFAMGVRGVPDYPTLQQHPDPALTGRLAYSSYDRSRGRCLFVQDIGGAPREFGCETGPSMVDKSRYFTWFGFDGAGRLVVADNTGPADGVLTTYDPVTFAVVDSRALTSADGPPDRTVRADGARVYTQPGHRDGSWTVRVTENGTDREVLALRGPDDYSLWNAEWSSDGRWILVRDSAGRFLVLADAADPAPRVLKADVDEVVWWQGRS